MWTFNPTMRGYLDVLMTQLNSRFQVVETTKTYLALYNNRDKKKTTSESYAAELKRLYEEAHLNRSPDTRAEDLLCRFLDEKARFRIEYIKGPTDIDFAVYATEFSGDDTEVWQEWWRREVAHRREWFDPHPRALKTLHQMRRSPKVTKE